MFRFFLILVIVTFFCRKDQEEPIITADTIHYDGPNQNAPLLARGISYPAVKFSAEFLRENNHLGKQLNQVDFHLTQKPEQIKLLIFAWNMMTDSIPGDLLYEEDLRNLKRNSWNSHLLNTRITIPSNGLWIAFEINTGDEDMRVIGCDPGPRKNNGDIYGLFGDNNPGWINFFAFSQESVNINWNIRANTK